MLCVCDMHVALAKSLNDESEVCPGPTIFIVSLSPYVHIR